MKIIFINTVANSGSTGKIVTSLYRYVKERDVDSCIVYGRGTCQSDIHSYKVGNRIDFVIHVCRNFFRGESGFGSTKNTLKLVEYLKQEKPDIIHLHNIHGFYLNCEVLFNYLKNDGVRVVWTLHDCWPFTGHCAYFDYTKCSKWKSSCCKCPQHRTSYPYALFCDNSLKSFEKKKKIFQGVKNLTIVTPSNWLADLVKKSFLSYYPVEVIHNGIDNNISCSCILSKEDSLQKKKVVLGVANVWEKRKGLDYFRKLADDLPDNYQIVLVGLNWWQEFRLRFKFSADRVTTIRRTRDVVQLYNLYKKADVYVNPTLEDNYPTTNMEALACGTPVVTFNTGGSAESLDSSCGIVVEKGNAKELIVAIERVCTSDSYSEEACRKRAEQFDSKTVWNKYLLLYEKIYTK